MTTVKRKRDSPWGWANPPPARLPSLPPFFAGSIWTSLELAFCTHPRGEQSGFAAYRTSEEKSRKGKGGWVEIRDLMG